MAVTSDLCAAVCRRRFLRPLCFFCFFFSSLSRVFVEGGVVVTAVMSLLGHVTTGQPITAETES